MPKPVKAGDGKLKGLSVCKDVKAEAIPIKGHTLEGGICKDCGAQVQLIKGTRYAVCATDGTKTIRYANYTGGSNSSITLSKRDFPDTKLEVSDGKVKKLAFVGFSNDGEKTIFAAGTRLPGSILECMTPTAENEVYFEAVYKAEDSSDQSYDYSLSGKTVNRKTLYQTSDRISVTVDKAGKQIIATIPKGYDKTEVSGDATEALMEAWEGTYMPGGAGAFFSIVIDNQSDKEFKYKNGSFIIQSPSFTPDGNTFDFENKVYGYITGARTFDGETPYYTYGAIRTSNEALKALYKTSKKLTVEQLLDSQLGNMLKEYEYENGIDDLAEYYLDYINAKKGTSYTNLNQVPDIVLTSDGPFGGYVVNSDAKESNPEIAGAGYSYFYNRLLSVVPQDNPKDATGAFSLGNYMSGEASYESYCNKGWAAIGKDQQAALTAMGFDINGPYCTNPYQNMDFGFEIGFQLTSENEEQPPVDPPYIPPVDPPTPVAPPVDPDQPLPPDENLEDPDQPSQDLPDDEHLESDDPVKQVKSENPDQPKTGDESQLAFYLIIAMSACGALSVTVRRKRRTK